MASYSAGRDIPAKLISEPSTGTKLDIAANDQIRPIATTTAIHLEQGPRKAKEMANERANGAMNQILRSTARTAFVRSPDWLKMKNRMHRRQARPAC